MLGSSTDSGECAGRDGEHRDQPWARTWSVHQRFRCDGERAASSYINPSAPKIKNSSNRAFDRSERSEAAPALPPPSLPLQHSCMRVRNTTSGCEVVGQVAGACGTHGSGLHSGSASDRALPGRTSSSSRALLRCTSERLSRGKQMMLASADVDNP